jgi:hypothetical protein
MKKLVNALMIFMTATLPIVPAALAVTPPVRTQDVPIFSALSNGGFENGTSFWTSSGGTLTTTSTPANVYAGNTAGSWDSNAAAQTLTSQSITVGGLAGTNGEATCWVQVPAGTATTTMGLWDGTNLINARTISNPSGTTTYFPTTINFVYGAAASTLAIRFTSVNANEPNINIDGCYISKATNFTNTFNTQPQLVGTCKMTGSSTFWQAAGSTPNTVFPPATGTSYAVTGQALAPATNIPACKFASLSAGDYRVEYEGSLQVNGTTNTISFYQFSDGTNLAREISTISAGQNATGGAGQLSQTFSYATSQSNITFQVTGWTNDGNGAKIFGTNTQPGVIKVWYFPNQPQSAIRPDLVSQAWYGTHNVTANWSTTSNTLVDVSNATGVSLVELVNRNFGTVTTAAGNLPGITFTPTRVGLYKVCSYGIVYNGSSGAITSLSLTDGTTQIAYFAIRDPAGSDSSLLSLCGLYSITNTATKTIKLQMAATSGTSSLGAFNNGQGRNITWIIYQVDQSFPAPLITGNTINNSPGTERIERISFGGAGTRTAPTACSSTPCTIYDQSGSWVTSVTRNGTGDYTLNVVSGMFSALPTCSGIGVGTNGTYYLVPTVVSGWTTTSLRFAMGFNGTAADAGSQIICMGPKGFL